MIQKLYIEPRLLLVGLLICCMYFTIGLMGFLLISESRCVISLNINCIVGLLLGSPFIPWLNNSSRIRGQLLIFFGLNEPLNTPNIIWIWFKCKSKYGFLRTSTSKATIQYEYTSHFSLYFSSNFKNIRYKLI
jgi:hypothetical protein